VTDTTDVDVDALLGEILLTPEGKSNPYPRYAAVREAGPAFRTAIGVVVVARYDDCQFILRDARFGKGELAAPWEQYGMTEDAWVARFPNMRRRMTSMLGLNPPDHTRLRRLVAKAFTPKTVETLRPEIERLTDELLERFDTNVDIMSELALPLPVAVIGEMLGIPESERVELQPYIRDSVKTLEFDPPLEALDVAAAASEVIAEHLDALIAARRAEPTDDLLSQLIHVEEEGDQLSYDELVTTVMLLFGAGFETTTNLIGNGLLALLDHPGEMERLRADPSLGKTAIEEMLRWDSPVQIDGREAFEDIDLHGVGVARGEEVITLLGSANRDPRVYDDPDRFDVGRVAQAPMSFGAGIHYCLGAALARAEGHVVFERLLARYPSIEPAWGDTRPAYRDSIVLHGLESLPVRVA